MPTPAERKAAVETARQKGDPGTLTALINGMREEARAVDVSDDTLTIWYLEQLATVTGMADRKRAACEKNIRLMQGPHDERWPKFWRLEAEARYLEETVMRLRKAGHILVCPNHGIGTSSTVGADPPWLKGLSQRGLLTEGGGSTDWQRYCVTCASTGPLVGEILRLQHNHEAANAPRKGKVK